MKKSLFTIIAIFVSTSIFAQAWTDIGVKFGYGIGLLINKNVFDDVSYSHEINGSYNFGGKISLNVGDHNAITFDAMLSQMKQNFNYSIAGGPTTNRNEIVWNNLDLYLMLRTNRQGAYLEIGPMMSRVRKITQTDTVHGSFGEGNDVSAFYIDRYFSAVLGGGSYMYGEGKFTTMLGMRLHYGLQDIISPRGQDYDNDFAFPNPSRNPSNIYDTYQSTNPIFVEFILELNFGLGYFAKAACSNRITWFSGRN